jgi:hypothetical protein
MARLEDKIRILCAAAVVSKDDNELRSLLDELRDALHQHIERLRDRLIAYPFVRERRERNGVSPSNVLTVQEVSPDQQPKARRNS